MNPSQPPAAGQPGSVPAPNTGQNVDPVPAPNTEQNVRPAPQSGASTEAAARPAPPAGPGDPKAHATPAKPEATPDAAKPEAPKTEAPKPEATPDQPKPETAPAASQSGSTSFGTKDTPAPDAPEESASEEPTSDDPRTAAVGSWELDVSHSEVEFTVRHLMSRVRGSFTDFTGKVEVPSPDFREASVEATIQVGSLTTHNEQRDAHVRSTDFFKQTEQTITFRSTEILEAPRAKYQRADSGDDWVIVGDLTINGVTHEVDLSSEFLGVGVDAFGVTRIGVTANTQINRKDYDVSFNVPLDGDKVMLGDRIDIDLVIQATKA